MSAQAVLLSGAVRGLAVRKARALVLVAAIAASGCGPGPISDEGINPRDNTQVAKGRGIYEQHCASCHGAKLEGQPNWRQRGPNGRLPAPPHDDSGHTWHHPNSVLFAITKNGLRPPHAPDGYVSDMPSFAGALNDDDIRAVLAYIESHWSDEVWKARREMTRKH